MAIKTPQEYIESLKDGRVVYCNGEKVPDVTEHPVLKVCRDWVAMDYVLNNDPRFQDLLTDVNEDGERVSFALMPQRTKEDLLRLREVVKLWARVCFGKPPGAKFVAKDGLNALTVVSRRVDTKYGTHYAENVEAYRRHLQQNDLAFAMGLTDTKGDRSLRPHQQEHPDYYVHIVEEREDGIVVSGAKTHISQAPLCNEILIAPCRAMTENDKAYAVAFGVPVNAEGLTLVSAEPEIAADTNLFDHPIAGSVFINDATILFDRVFIPNDRIFLKGEWEFAGQVAYMFANFHRLSAETYKAMELELFTGAATLMAEYNGIEKAPHVREKLTWLVMYTEAVEVLGRAACEYCNAESDSDLVYPNPMYANICKFYFADNWHQATKYIQDIAGGIVATCPSAKDFFHPEIHEVLKKVLGGKAGIPTEDRLRMVKLVRDLTSSYEDVLTIHAEGSLEAQKLSILVLGDMKRYKAAAMRAAGIKNPDRHPVFDSLPQFPPEL
ncbi:4-hydroxyphenylacetate 3-hydroxylase N-terminal domain-containing protein [Desulfatiglans anilini]|uniref:4-hydroxyphenylacetate 3-hydroxylase N-terminal domain-containing protein n=1 Tax=Desulfatiglans anilini TaxID=90728 RepID=UPI0003F593CE|nr:4-hydroxyphenylacetate 3-hydroxylase N-terminal domain-containing protein [Desulfatiglans anilini]